MTLFGMITRRRICSMIRIRIRLSSKILPLIQRHSLLVQQTLNLSFTLPNYLPGRSEMFLSHYLTNCPLVLMEFHINFWKKPALGIVGLLTTPFNRSISLGQVPHEWKRHCVPHLQRWSQRQAWSNQLSTDFPNVFFCVARTMEKLLHCQVLEYLQRMGSCMNTKRDSYPTTRQCLNCASLLTSGRWRQTRDTMSKLHFWISARPIIVWQFLAYCSNYQIWCFRRNFALVLIVSHKQTAMCPRQWEQLKYTMLNIRHPPRHGAWPSPVFDLHWWLAKIDDEQLFHPIAQTPHVTRNANERERDRFENREKRINKWLKKTQFSILLSSLHKLMIFTQRKHPSGFHLKPSHMHLQHTPPQARRIYRIIHELNSNGIKQWTERTKTAFPTLTSTTLILLSLPKKTFLTTPNDQSERFFFESTSNTTSPCDTFCPFLWLKSRSWATYSVLHRFDKCSFTSRRYLIRLDASARLNEIGDVRCSSSGLWGSPTKKFPMSIAGVNGCPRSSSPGTCVSGRLLTSASISTSNVSSSFFHTIDRPRTFFKGSLTAFTSLS